MHLLSNEHKEQWIEDYVERETAGAGNRDKDAGEAVQQELEEIKQAEILGLMTREPEKIFEETMVAMEDDLNDLASSDDGEDGEDEDDKETKQGKVCKYDKHGWVMGTITNTLQQRMERFRQM